MDGGDEVSHVHVFRLKGYPIRATGRRLALIRYKCRCGRVRTERTSRVRAVEVAR